MFNPNDIQTLDTWLDEQVAEQYKEQPLAQDWARIAKIGEEFGEVVSAFIGVTGQNPRKGFIGSQDDVDDELADVALTAILALQHRTGDVETTEGIIQTRVEYRMRNMTLPSK
jgi:NTP pyrophosphatase (non-canonical NTP hydrolase)